MKIVEVNLTYEDMVKRFPIGSEYTDKNKKYKVIDYGEHLDIRRFPTMILKPLPNEETKVSEKHIDEIIENSELRVFHRIFGKQCVAIILLPNGFTIVGQSACIDPDNYEEEIGLEIAMDDIKHQLWNLEGYLKQNELI